MKVYTNTEPSFSEEILIPETSDSNHAENFNKAYKPLLDNTLVNHKNIDELKKSMDALKKNVSDGKSAIASAITDRLGISTATDDTFEQMANNILSYRMPSDFHVIKMLDSGQYINHFDEIYYNKNGVIDGHALLEDGQAISNSIITGFQEYNYGGGHINVEPLYSNINILVNLSVNKDSHLNFNIDMHNLYYGAIVYMILLDKNLYNTFENCYDKDRNYTDAFVYGTKWADSELYPNNGSIVATINDTIPQGEYIFGVVFSNIETFSVNNKMQIVLY